MKKPIGRGSAGFTIIELLIATMVFALVLIIITVSVLNITKTYFRGVSQAATQNAARTIIETITQSIQFSGDSINPNLTPNPNGSKGFCLGNQRYSYVLGWQLVDGDVNVAQRQTAHALVVDADSGCSGSPSQDVRGLSPVLAAGNTELLSPRMRLAKLKVEPAGDPSLWQVTIRVVFGDNDLLCSPSTPGDCTSADVTSSFDKDDLTCKVAFSGSQYCATSELSTTVKKRISSSP